MRNMIGNIDICANCGGRGRDYIYDELSENTFCDRECFAEWADDNFEEVVEFYFQLNCE